jgi:hypothetical protein
MLQQFLRVLHLELESVFCTFCFPSFVLKHEYFGFMVLVHLDNFFLEIGDFMVFFFHLFEKFYLLFDPVVGGNV